MSRHLIPNPADFVSGTETVVGWDRPLSTFFLLIRPPEESDGDQVWLGLAAGEFYELDRFLPVLARHGIVLPDRLVLALFMDRDLGRASVTDWRSGVPVPVGKG
ncbi:hypothetical protein GCM10009839_14220 [Catenulispora yoronensis]|uniref:Uncharacterized protein n=1 Tax=Catenulispora yoronensis TaxID=450799 RepID=A0ABN2TSD5_9ACTN